jgi:2-methylisocitrate lyase-like PEP mutase family enzyme
MVPSAAARSQARVTVPERLYCQEESMKTTTALRQLLCQPGIIVAPGAYDCLTVKLIEREGFTAVYMTGAGTAVTRLGRPDLGFATLTERLANASLMGLQESLALDAKWPDACTSPRA